MNLSYKRLSFSVPVHCMMWLKRRMRYVRAAGCIVTDDGGNMLLIRRNGRWDLPKGKVEAGETLLQAALRETLEETGVRAESGEWKVEGGKREVGDADGRGVSAMGYSRPAIKTYHIYNLYGGWHLKQTSWFEAHAAGEMPQGCPQDEEGISEVVWVAPELWHRRLKTSYGTLRRVERGKREVKSNG